MSQSIAELEVLQAQIRAFVKARDWDQFHTPKNLAMALAGEAGELMELFQWLTPAESSQVMQDAKQAEAIRDELADVFVYTLRVCDVLGVDLKAAVQAKMQKNAAKYPEDLARGNATKYDQLK